MARNCYALITDKNPRGFLIFEKWFDCERFKAKLPAPHHYKGFSSRNSAEQWAIDFVENNKKEAVKELEEDPPPYVPVGPSKQNQEIAKSFTELSALWKEDPLNIDEQTLWMKKVSMNFEKLSGIYLKKKD